MASFPQKIPIILKFFPPPFQWHLFFQSPRRDQSEPKSSELSCRILRTVCFFECAFFFESEFHCVSLRSAPVLDLLYPLVAWPQDFGFLKLKGRAELVHCYGDCALPPDAAEIRSAGQGAPNEPLPMSRSFRDRGLIPTGRLSGALLEHEGGVMRSVCVPFYKDEFLTFFVGFFVLCMSQFRRGGVATCCVEFLS